MQKDATTPNIVGPRMLRVVASVLALVCKRMQQLQPCCNNIKQGVLTDATVTVDSTILGVVDQECWVRLQGASKYHDTAI